LGRAAKLSEAQRPRCAMTAARKTQFLKLYGPARRGTRSPQQQQVRRKAPYRQATRPKRAARTPAADHVRRLARRTEPGARAELSYPQCGDARFAASDRAHPDAVHPAGPAHRKRFIRLNKSLAARA